MTKRHIAALLFAGALATHSATAGAQEANPETTPEPTQEAPLDLEPPVAPDASETPPGESAAALGEPAAEPTAGYKKGFFIRAADAPFEVHMQQRVQTRYALEIPDDGDNDSALSIARARLSFSGYAFTKNLLYKFQTDFGKGFVTLKDFYGDYKIIPEQLHLRIGQFKRPFSRQQINSSGSLELVDRAITDKFFGGGRDIGIAIHNDYEHSPEFEYAVGIFNGTGDKSLFSGDVAVDPVTGEGEVSGGGFSNVPDRMHPAIVARIGHNYGGIKGYSEADLEGGPLRFAIGASGLVDFDGDKDDASGIRGQADYAVKVAGLSSTGGLYISSAQSGAAFTEQSYAALGLHLQAGYVLAGRYQPVVRYARLAPKGSDNDRHEALVGFSMYFFNHGLKWQSEAGALVIETPSGRQDNFVAQSQLQLAF